MARVFGEDAAGFFGFVRLAGFFAGGDFLRGEVESESVFHGVDGDGVAVFDQADGAADRGFRGDVADDEAVTAAGEASVGDERDFFPRPRP